MCGRFRLQHTLEETRYILGLDEPEDWRRNTPPRYNIAPAQDVLFVAARDGNAV